MASKPQRRQRYEGLTIEQTAQQLSDDLDAIEGDIDEHVAEDEKAFKAIAEQFNEWKLSSLRFQRNQLLAGATVLFVAIVSLIVQVATK